MVLQSGFGDPRTMFAGLSVDDTPFLVGKSFRHSVALAAMLSIMSLGTREYGMDAHMHRTRSFTVRTDRSTSGTCWPAAQRYSVAGRR